MTPDPATVALCAAAQCYFCSNDRYTPAAPDADGNRYHTPLKGKRDEIWCEANLVWSVLDAVTPAPRPDALGGNA
jgi:hypothetical protein